MSSLPPGFFYDLIHKDEVQAAHNIEVESFPVGEAASLSTFVDRQRDAPDLFLGAFVPIVSESQSLSGRARTIVGFACGTRSSSDSLTAESMKTNVADGRMACIHAVVTVKAYRRLGIASALLREYVRRLCEVSESRYDRVALLCHDELRGLYERVGFKYIGPSSVVHGPRPWLEMRVDFKDGVEQDTRGEHTKAELGSAPPGIFEALQASAASRARPAVRLLSTFESIEEVVVCDGSESGTLRNIFDLLCPRPGCSCTILKAGAGQLIEKEGIAIDPAAQAPSALLATLPEPGQQVRCWLIGPTPMAFENIGFSKPVCLPNEGVRLKLLSCADCDLGPLGWSEEGGREFWILCARVGYRA